MTQPPNQQAPAGIIGVVIPWLGHPDHIQMLEGIRGVLGAHGYAALAYQAGFEGDDSGHVHNFMLERYPFGEHWINGWIVMNIPPGAAWVAAQQAAGRPIVQISPQQLRAGAPVVVPDNIGGARLATTHLLQLQHQRIAFLGNLDHADIRARYTGYLQACEQHGIQPDPALTISITWRSDFWSEAAGADALRQLLERTSAFTAIFAATDALASGALQALHDAGLRVPDDIALVGFDNAEVSRTTEPPLTTVGQPFEILGETAAEMLLELLSGRTLPAEPAVVPAMLVVRTSCGTPPAHLSAPHMQLPSDIPDDDTILDELMPILRGNIGQTPLRYMRALRSALAQVLEAFRAALRSATAHDTIVWAQMVRRMAQLVGAMGVEPVNGQNVLIALRDLHTILAPDAPNPAERAAQASHLCDVGQRVVMDLLMHILTDQRNRWGEAAISSYRILQRMMELDRSELPHLAWLDATTVRQAYLLLYDQQNARDVVRLRGVYPTDRTDTPELRLYPTNAIPLPEILAACPDLPLSLFPINTFANVFGALLVATDPADAVYRSSIAGVWATQIAAQLELGQLVDSLQEHRSSLEQAFEHERALADTLRQLACPVIPVAAGVLVVPLIGAVDSQRAQQIIQNVLEGIGTHSADAVVIDITGVPVVDTSVASYLLQTAQAAKLLGAQVILTGISPEIAQTIVQLGVPTGQLTTQSDLAAGIRMVLRRRGLGIMRLPAPHQAVPA